MLRHRNGVLLSLLAVLLVASGCAGGDPGDGGGGGGEDEGGGGESEEVSIVASWTGDEQTNFEEVLAAAEEETGDTYRYQGSDDMATFLGTQIEGGEPPDVALIAQPGLVADLVADGSLVELGDEAAAQLEENYAPIWSDLGSVDGTLYGLYFKAASKATWWYNTALFQQAGVEPPGTWEEMLEAASTVNQSGVPWMTIGGADAWPITDIWENVYLQVGGPEKYDQLAAHEIPWTDPSVIESFNVLAELFGDEANLAGGTKGVLQEAFTDSAAAPFLEPPEAATVYLGDFAAGIISAETKATVGEDADFFDFPTIEEQTAVVGGGDMGVALTDNPGAQRLLAFLGTPEAAEIWASKGGFTSPNANLDTSVYPDEITRRIAENMIEAADAGTFRFDLSDLLPAEFGATAGRGLWQRMQEFVENPDDAEGIAQKLEADAKKAF